MKEAIKDKKLKNIFVSLVLIFFISGVAGVVFDRVIWPNVATWPFFRNFSILSPRTPVVITKTEEVRIDDGINQAQIGARVKNSLVTVYIHEGDLGSGKYRVLAELPGFVLTSDGLIGFASNLPLARAGLNYTVLGLDGRTYSASRLATDNLTGLSFLRIKADNLAVVKQGSSVRLSPGEKLLILSSSPPDLFSHPVTVYASAVPETSLKEQYDFAELNSFVRVDWVPEANHLGAIAVDKDGLLVGVITDPSRTNKFQIVRSEDMEMTVRKLLSDSGVSWTTQKFVYQVLSPAQAGLLGLPKKYGVLLKTTSASELRVADFVFAINSQGLTPADNFQSILLGKSVGERVRMSLIRAGVQREVEITL